MFHKMIYFKWVKNMNRMYLCIDLKSFYASVECVERNLNPFNVNLVVADPTRCTGAITLAISPRLKQLGVKNRCRVYEIPKDINYITAMPRMELYMQYSANIYKIYLKYVAKEDIFVYSIDECFLDITTYLYMYKMSEIELAKMIINDVYKTTGITATAGIGTNMFLAKVALDITAKKSSDNIGFLNEEIFKRTIWFHTPITDIWNIGPGIAKRLAKYNAYSLYAVSNLNERLLYEEFGVNAKNIIEHSKGIDNTTINDIHSYKPKNNSLSNSQILYEDYNYDDAFLVFNEMVENNCRKLIKKKLVASRISIYVGYSKDVIKPTGMSMKLYECTNSYMKLNEYFKMLFVKTTNKNYMIRRLGISFSVLDEKYKTYDLFTDYEKENKEISLQKSIILLKEKYGKNIVLKAMNLEKNATQVKRNKLIGGHNAK